VEGRADPEGRTPPTWLGIAAGVVFVAIAAVGAYSLATDPYLPLGKSGSDPGPAFVPWIAIWIMGIGGACQIVVTIAQARRAGGLQWAGEFTLSRLWLPIALFLSMLVYVLLMLQPLGFLVSSSIFATVWVAIFHWRSGDHLKPIHAVQLPVEAILIVGVIYMIFRYAILVPLP
jgi:hypothetical protein